MIKIFYPIVVLYLCSLTGCLHFAVATKDNPTCKTVIRGVFRAPIDMMRFDKNERPLIISKKNGVQRIEVGKIVSMDSNGVYFNRNKVGAGVGGGVRFYPYSEILCLFDSSNTVVYGAISACDIPQWSLQIGIVPTSKPDADPLWMILKNNEEFSFCLTPGEYIVVSTQFSFGSNLFVNTDIPGLFINARADTSSYLGELIMDDHTSAGEKVRVKCYRKTQGGSMPAGGESLGFVAMGIAIAFTERIVEHTLEIQKGTIPQGSLYAPMFIAKKK